ncbi:unnamed protein product, partial [Ixodes hexagonus]
ENCQNKQCNFCKKKMAEKEITSHEDICDEKIVECRYSKYECQRKGPRRQIKRHQEYDSHVFLFLPIIQACRTLKLQDRVQELEPPINALLEKLQPIS